MPYNDAGSTPLSRQEMLDRIRDLLKENEDIFTPSHRKVLWYRFGVETNVYHTKEETAEHFGVSPERIRLVEERFLRSVYYQVRRRRYLDGFITPKQTGEE